MPTCTVCGETFARQAKTSEHFGCWTQPGEVKTNLNHIGICELWVRVKRSRRKNTKGRLRTLVDNYHNVGVVIIGLVSNINLKNENQFDIRLDDIQISLI
jgi:hypothetical protein